MTTPATIQVQQGETMTSSIPSNQPTGDQGAEIAALKRIISVAQANADADPDPVDAGAWGTHAKWCRELLLMLEGQS